MLYKALIQKIKNPAHFCAAVCRKLYFLFPNDCFYLKLIYYLEMGKKLNLKNPETFTEKLQWLKLYDRRLKYTKMVDKVTVKEYVTSVIGEEYVIPTLGVWDRVEDIEWEKLPDKFVIKTSNGGGSSGVFICNDKSNFDIKSVTKKLCRALKSNIYRQYREWPYKNIQPRVIAETLLEDKNSEEEKLADYKFYCFNGVPVYCQVIRDRGSKETIDFYDMQWKHMSFVGLTSGVKNGVTPVVKPVCLGNMVKLCRKLSEGIPFSRIDLYVANNKEYFGEITFYPASGLGTFRPEKWNVKLGDLLKLAK